MWNLEGPLLAQRDGVCSSPTQKLLTDEQSMHIVSAFNVRASACGSLTFMHRPPICAKNNIELHLVLKERSLSTER